MIFGSKLIKRRRKFGLRYSQKIAGCLHRTAQPPTLATFRSWGSSAGAGRVRPAAANIQKSLKCSIELTVDLTNC